MTHIRKTILIHTPIEKVHDVSHDPKGWSAWFAGLSEPDEINGNGDTGTIVKHHYTMAGLPFPITTRVVEDTFGPKEGRWRGDFHGAITGTHTFLLAAKGENTEVTSEIDYEIPGSVFGKIADRLVIEKMQERNLEHTLENLKLLCEAEVAAPVHA